MTTFRRPSAGDGKTNVNDDSMTNVDVKLPGSLGLNEAVPTNPTRGGGGGGGQCRRDKVM